MSGVVVRPATTSDVDLLPDIEVRAGERFRQVGLDVIADDEPPTAEALRRHVAAGTAWVAELDGVVVGYALASEVDGEGHLDQVSVVPEASGRGLGRALVEQVLTWAADQGFVAVTLTTFRDVDWNGPLYRHLGFVEVEEQSSGPELADVRRRERALGLDVAPRVAMRRSLADWT